MLVEFLKVEWKFSPREAPVTIAIFPSSCREPPEYTFREEEVRTCCGRDMIAVRFTTGGLVGCSKLYIVEYNSVDYQPNLDTPKLENWCKTLEGTIDSPMCFS
jgi:hypothetical protein